MKKEYGWFGFGALLLVMLLAAPASVGAVAFQVPGTDTTIDVGGYVKLDVIYNDVSAGNNSQSNIEFVPSDVPLEGFEEGEDEVVMNARESRLRVRTTTPTTMGPLVTHLEGDFDTAAEGNQVVSNSHGFRLRHAYMTFANFTFGQTWSLFMHLESLPELNDFGGPTGTMFVRQPLLRYSWALNDTNMLEIGVENAETYYYDGGFLVEDDDDMPDVIVRYSLNPGWGNVSAAVMGRRLVVEDGATDDSTFGFAGQLGFLLKTFGRDTFYGSAQYGEGIGRYSSLAAHPDAYVSGGDLEALEQVAGFVGYQHWWGGTWRSNVIVGYTKADDPVELQATDATEETMSVHVNLFFDPIPNTRLGIEYIRGEREVYDGRDGELNRVQFSAVTYF